MVLQCNSKKAHGKTVKTFESLSEDEAKRRDSFRCRFHPPADARASRGRLLPRFTFIRTFSEELQFCKLMVFD